LYNIEKESKENRVENMKNGISKLRLGKATANLRTGLKKGGKNEDAIIFGSI